MADPQAYPDPDGDTGGPGRGWATGTPRWVKVSWIIGVVLVLLLAVMLISGRLINGRDPGRHDPGRHVHGGLGDQPPASSVTVHGGQPS